MRLILLRPDVAVRSCEDCSKYLYKDSPTRFGEVSERMGIKTLRMAGQDPPCRWCPKIPDGEPKIRSSAVELSDRNWQAFRHYRECRAVGRFPDDPIVSRNAGVIRQIQDDADARQAQRTTFVAMASALGRTPA